MMEQMRITTFVASCNAMPSMNSPIIGVAKEGTVVDVLERGDRWHKVSFQDKKKTVAGYTLAACLADVPQSR
jgi:hypothetical protein